MVIHGHEHHGGRRAAATPEALIRAQSRDSHRRNQERARRGSTFDRICGAIDRLIDGSTARGKRGR